MKIEQMMEYTHALFNELESTRKSEKNRAKRFFQMIQAKENMYRSDKKMFLRKLKLYNKKDWI